MLNYVDEEHTTFAPVLNFDISCESAGLSLKMTQTLICNSIRPTDGNIAVVIADIEALPVADASRAA